MEKKINISFCNNNINRHEYKEEFEVWQQQYKDVAEIHSFGCLGRCIQCRRMPYALIEDKLLLAASPRELKALLDQELQQKK